MRTWKVAPAPPLPEPVVQARAALDAAYKALVAADRADLAMKLRALRNQLTSPA